MALSTAQKRGIANGVSRGAQTPARCVRVHAIGEHKSLASRVAPALLASVIALSSGFTTIDAAFAPPARADGEENLSPLERRRALLRAAREKAEAASSATKEAEAEPKAEPEPEPEAPKTDFAGAAPAHGGRCAATASPRS
ncbi:hypothetical protein MNEG_16631 [Monoraphidium neglectum]|uniref:Uncharacterized protein n=1 Tax=Monoraphidium neglectum TaxID=145388 RepID=A0A0D2K5A1_9CHLO|nr:hypothetical protein MNEG_16631 [Monoraphidium neglectum]KIY91333.1 hypothetical protein MNEG_16631 [Monoraphidium neglectum]|eukprot:XP_013890353.1 hypothetical protein MNEG_16631 [Monoraphidium neglectum]